MKCPPCIKHNSANKPSSSDKWRYTLITTMVLLVIMNPYSYNLMEAFFGKIIGKILEMYSGVLGQDLTRG